MLEAGFAWTLYDRRRNNKPVSSILKIIRRQEASNRGKPNTTTLFHIIFKLGNVNSSQPRGYVTDFNKNASFFVLVIVARCWFHWRLCQAGGDPGASVIDRGQRRWDVELQWCHTILPQAQMYPQKHKSNMGQTNELHYCISPWTVITYGPQNGATVQTYKVPWS